MGLRQSVVEQAHQKTIERFQNLAQTVRQTRQAYIKPAARIISGDEFLEKMAKLNNNQK